MPRGDDPAEVRLTELEAAVFRALQEDGRVRFTTIAQRLGVSEAHVRRTVKQLVAKDVFAITAVADPRLLGLESMAWLALSVRLSHIEATAAALAALPEVDYVVITTGAWNVMAEVACRDTAALFALLKRVRSLPGVQRTETYPYFELLRQQFRWTDGEDVAIAPAQVAARGVRGAPAAELDAIDRVLIRELQDDGRASFRDIGQRLGVSERAVSGRFARLADEDLVRVIAVGNPHALGFQGLAWLGIVLDDMADIDEVALALARIPQVSYLVTVSGRFDLMGELVCRDRDHLIATLNDRIGAIAGVDSVEVFFYLRLLYRNTAGAWGAARSGPGGREGEGDRNRSEPADVRPLAAPRRRARP
jgi:Lrp/AsnC family transcriptional regulator for asnA, asnC and gidA